MGKSWTLEDGETAKVGSIDDETVSKKSVSNGHIDQGSDGSATKIIMESDSEADSTEGKCCLKCCAPEARPGYALVKIFFCCIAGVVFGWCMEKSRVFEPASIRLQMVVERWVMLKMFLAAVASGQIVLALLSVIPWCKDKFQKAMEGFGACFSEKGILTSILGPFILGMGMTVSGACPGMVLPQVGAWTKNSIFTFVGVLAGALIYGLIAPFIIKLTRPKKTFDKQTLHALLKVPYIALALPMAVVLTLAVFLMEWFIPWTEDLDCWNRNYIATPDSTNIFTLKSWYPGAAGGVLGVMQVLIVLAAEDTLGGSSAYVTIISQWVIGKRLKECFPYLAKARCGLGNWWQVFYVLFAVGGGAFSALASDSMATAQGVSIPAAVCGGFMLVFGSRLAAGCTSGHGLSGMGLLYWVSFIALPAMFGGGFVAGFAMKATGALYDFKCHNGYCPPVYNIPTYNCTQLELMM